MASKINFAYEQHVLNNTKRRAVSPRQLSVLLLSATIWIW